MARLKYTMLFQLRTNLTGGSNNARIAGWSESVYGESGITVPNDILFNQLMTARAACLPLGAGIIGQRYNVVDPTGGSSAAAFPFPGSWPFTSDIPQMALLLKLPADAQPNVGKQEMRGIPDGVVIEGEFRDPGGYTAVVQAYIDQLHNWRFKARNLNALSAQVLSIDGSGNVVTLQDFPISGGEMIRVLRSVDPDGNRVGGLFKADTPTDLTHFKLLNWPAGQIAGLGRVRVDETIYPVYASLGGTGQKPYPRPIVMVRKVGRPSGGYRGRASSRR